MLLPLLNPGIVTVLLSGCILSVDPIVADSDALFDQRLVRRWAMSSSGFATVNRMCGRAHAIEYPVEGKTRLGL